MRSSLTPLVCSALESDDAIRCCETETANRAMVDWRFAQARMRLRATHTAPQFHRALEIAPNQVPGPWGRAGPMPQANLRLLTCCKESGGDPAAVLDGALAAQTATAFADNTHTTYSSHLNMIAWACVTICAEPIPADLVTVQRVAGIVNDSSTLRGWLAAW